jgi:hypothetical protein
MLDERVLRPMGIAADRVVWRTNRYRPATLRGIPRREFGSGISTDVDVMARMGLMLLRGGRWRTTPILPPDYPDLAGSPAPGFGDLRCAGPRGMCPGANRHYGLLFWNNADGFMAAVPKDGYWSAGLGTSFILVIPSLDIVAARAGPRWPSPGRPGTWATEPFFALLAAAVVS